MASVDVRQDIQAGIAEALHGITQCTDAALTLPTTVQTQIALSALGLAHNALEEAIEALAIGTILDHIGKSV